MKQRDAEEKAKLEAAKAAELSLAYERGDAKKKAIHYLPQRKRSELKVHTGKSMRDRDAEEKARLDAEEKRVREEAFKRGDAKKKAINYLSPRSKEDLQKSINTGKSIKDRDAEEAAKHQVATQFRARPVALDNGSDDEFNDGFVDFVDDASNIGANLSRDRLGAFEGFAGESESSFNTPRAKSPRSGSPRSPRSPRSNGGWSPRSTSPHSARSRSPRSPRWPPVEDLMGSEARDFLRSNRFAMFITPLQEAGVIGLEDLGR